MSEEKQSTELENEKIAISPAQHEDDIASLEREAREKREQVLKQEQEEKSAHPIQPTINKLKKRKKGNTTLFLAIIAVVLIFLAWGSNWIYRNFIWQPTEEKKQDESGEKNSTDHRKRTDLGKNNETEKEAGSQKTESTQEKQNSVEYTPHLSNTGLNKALFLIRANNGETSQGKMKTRRDEMTLLTSGITRPTGESSSTQKEIFLQEKENRVIPVRRIPYNPDLYIPENTAIPCSMDYRFVSDKAGKLRCTIAKDIWSASGNTKLIEKGTTAFGLYQSGELKQGEGRAFIMVTKLRTRQPPYLDIPLINTDAAGALGESGVDGWIDNHFWKRFGGALMVGMIPDIGAWAANNTGKKDRNTDYTENSRQAMAEMAKTTLENSINIPPTLYKNQGEIINLITGQDIDFSNIYTLRIKND